MACLSANIHIKQPELTEGSSSGIPRLAYNGTHNQESIKYPASLYSFFYQYLPQPHVVSALTPERCMRSSCFFMSPI